MLEAKVTLSNRTSVLQPALSVAFGALGSDDICEEARQRASFRLPHQHAE